MARIISVASGKGGVGKTSISVNLAVHLAQKGFKVCLLDADLGLANANILLGLYPDYNLEDVIEKNVPLTEVILKNCYEIDIIPGSSGIEKMANISSQRLTSLIQSFSRLKNYDFIIIDTSAGISRNVISFCMASTEILLPVTHDPASLTDAYALIKTLTYNGYNRNVHIVINQCGNMKKARLIYTKFNETVKKYLSINVLPLGAIAYDPLVTEAARGQVPFIVKYPETKASVCIEKIGEKIKKGHSRAFKMGMDSFLEVFMSSAKGSLRLLKREMDIPDRNLKKVKGKSLVPAKNAIREKVPEKALPEKRFHPLSMKEPGAFNYYFAGLQVTLDKLMTGIDAISDELGSIRELIEKNNNDNSAPAPIRGREDNSKQKSRNGVTPPVISLDFEAYVERRKERIHSS